MANVRKKQVGARTSRPGDSSPQPTSRRVWGARAIGVAAAGLTATSRSAQHEEEERSVVALSGQESIDAVRKADPKHHHDTKGDKRHGRHTQLLIHIYDNPKYDPKDPGESAKYLAAFPEEVQVCTKDRRVVTMSLDHRSKIDTVYVKQKPHKKTAASSNGLHDFDKIFAIHPGGSYCADNEHPFVLKKDAPQVFVVKDKINDGAILKKGKCDFNAKTAKRPEARCIVFAYRADPKDRDEINHAHFHTDYHFEC